MNILLACLASHPGVTNVVVESGCDTLGRLLFGTPTLSSEGDEVGPRGDEARRFSHEVCRGTRSGPCG